ncbi:serine hydrolase domain-containing protein [Pseudidiomarina homiensis]|uniref:Beta-lactamase-related domain-containing protein n=1 Tax=Pseudidiomarina homiensis TaxID=364198 RepID=A0A432Y3Q7_9GAMM|nr:serine hydrolase domain-containing protein [Pseudidiomarina homiensis]RUO55541.1 hypothetical protein CWI70_01785 [Pseudidiomarina homiensis]
MKSFVTPLLTSAALTLFCFPSFALAQANSATDIDALVGAYHQTYGFTGTVKVVQGDQPLYEKSYGLANRSFAIENTPTTRNSINSISKTFTAFGILLLVENGKLDLHKSIGTYLPYLTADWKETVTIHHLLTHSSGLPRESGVQAHDELTLKQQVMRLVDQQTLLFNPGSQYGYSNSGLIVLGALLEQVTGKDYGAYITEQVLQPMQLNNTGYYRGRNVVDRQATPYRMSSTGLEFAQRSKHYGGNAGGGLYSTPSDLYQYVRAIESNQLLSAETTALLFTPHIHSGETDAEGYAWSIKKFGDETLHFAAGSGYGTKSVMIRAPESKDFISITSNWGNTPILNMLADIYLTLKGQSITPPDANQLAKPQDFAKQLGSYKFDPEQLKMHIGMDGDTVTLQAFENKLFLNDELMAAKGADVIGLTYTDEFRVQFQGKQMLIQINGNELRGQKVDD